MDDIKKFHYNRGKEMLKRTIIKHVSSSAVHSVLNTPELLYLIFQFTLPSRWIDLQLVCRSFEQTITPLIWRSISLNSVKQFKSILPLLQKYAPLVHSLDLSRLDHSNSDIFRELSQFTTLHLITLNLNNSPILTIQLQSILDLSYQLRSIDIRGCKLDHHPLDLLSPYRHLESLAFDHCDTPRLQNPKILSSWSNLRNLHIVYLTLNSPTTHYLLHDTICNTSFHLDSLELEFCCDSLTDSTFRNIISSKHILSSLTSLSFVNTKFSTSPLTNQGPLFPSVLSLFILDCPGISGLECLHLVQACPSLKELELDTIRTSPEDLKQMSIAASQLISFSIRGSRNGLEYIPKYCPNLRRFKVHSLLAGKHLTKIFENPWNCRSLEELVLGLVDFAVVFKKESEKVKSLTGHSITVMWSTLSKLEGLRILMLKGYNSQPEVYNRSKLTLLGTLTRLEVLCLAGFGPWEYRELFWVLDTFPWLEEFIYKNNEMSIPLQAWIRNNSPRLRNNISMIKVNKLKSSMNILSCLEVDYDIVYL